MSQTKSILLQLPLQKRLQFKEAVRKQALRDGFRVSFQEKIKDADRYSDLGSAMVCILSWGGSKQGHEYWWNIYMKASKKIIK
jgi:hypothetical protein